MIFPDLYPIEIKISAEEFSKLDAELFPHERYSDKELYRKGLRNLVFETFDKRKIILINDGQ